MQYMLIIVCAFCAHVLFAQVPESPFPGAYSRSFSQMVPQFRNTASLADLRHLSIGIFSERRFLLKEMSGYALTLGMPVSSGVLGMMLWQYGYALYREQLVGLAYALPLGNRLKAGLQLDYRRARMPGYGAGSVSGRIGLVGRLTEHCRIGLQIFNPSGSGGPPAVYIAGLGYEPSPQFLVEGEWRKETSMPLSSRICIAYRPVTRFWAMGGFVTQPAMQFAGIGYRVGDLRINVCGSYHLPLGITPSMMVVWGKK